MSPPNAWRDESLARPGFSSARARVPTFTPPARSPNDSTAGKSSRSCATRESATFFDFGKVGHRLVRRGGIGGAEVKIRTEVHGGGAADQNLGNCAERHRQK